jgi:hypothetical protein
MTGKAETVFTCGATIHYTATNGQECTDRCDTIIVVDLVNDGQYTNFNTPQDWHIELGVFDPTQTIVRCPKHCAWIDISAQYKGQGQWQDAP